MDSILMQQQLSFEHKMNNIQTTNTILDDLEQKMQSYFSKHAVVNSKITQQPHNRFQSSQNDRFNSQTNQFIRKKPISNYLINQNTDQNQDQSNQAKINRQQQLEFKLYNNYAQRKSQPKQQFQRYNQKIAPHPRIPNDGQNYKKQREKERMSQTTIYKNSNISQNNTNQIRGSSSVLKTRKSNQQFRLLGKSRGARQRQPQKQLNKQVQNQNSIKNPLQNLRQQYLKEQQQHGNIKSLKKKFDKSNQISHNYPQSSNSLLHSMQTIEIVMKQALDAKLRKIKQIQHQIMTQNQERVYLYKVNVRLNQQLKHLQQQQKSQSLESSKNLQWTIKTLQDDIDKIKKQISKKSNERKQLRKQQQTLKDGYQTVLNNKRNIMKKDLQNYINKHNQTKQNTQMLKGLMKQLDKLKGVVQAKIKSSSVSEKSKRKVIKSFKN